MYYPRERFDGYLGVVQRHGTNEAYGAAFVLPSIGFIVPYRRWTYRTTFEGSSSSNVRSVSHKDRSLQGAGRGAELEGLDFEGSSCGGSGRLGARAPHRLLGSNHAAQLPPSCCAASAVIIPAAALWLGFISVARLGLCSLGLLRDTLSPSIFLPTHLPEAHC